MPEELSQLTSLVPLVTFDQCELSDANSLCEQWGHRQGGCNRPFRIEAWMLSVRYEPVSVAISASTVNARCGGYDRQEVVELARLCTRPGDRWATRVCLRLWREVAARAWGCWPVRAVVSYRNALHHQQRANIYRFDGWTKVADVRGGVAGGGWSRGKQYDPKEVWVYELHG